MPDEQGLCGPNDGLAAVAAVVLDPRLADVWQLIWAEADDDVSAVNGVSLEAVGGLMRLAYLQGYADAATDPDPGALFAELGVRDPSINRPIASGRRRAIGRARRDSSGR
jgi:hypothetical protein